MGMSDRELDEVVFPRRHQMTMGGTFFEIDDREEDTCSAESQRDVVYPVRTSGRTGVGILRTGRIRR